MDICFPMHPITTVIDCPRHGRCSFCWTFEFGETVPYQHYRACPAIYEMGAKVAEKTGTVSASILPISIPNPVAPNALVATSVSAKRVREANMLSPQEVQQLGQPKTKAPKKMSKSSRNWAAARVHAQAALAAAKAHRPQQNQPPK